MNIDISIICPVYNKQRYIKDTIESVLNQTFKTWELLLIDDGSTDGSIEIAKEYASMDARITVLPRVNFNTQKGASVCRNIGTMNAVGRYIMFLDADDCLIRACLEQRFYYAQKYDQFDVFVFNTLNFYHKLPTRESCVIKYDSSVESGREGIFLKRFCKYELPWNISAPLWKRPSLLRIGGFTESFQRLQDPELHIRALISGLRFGRIKYSIADVAIRLDEDRRSHDYAEHLDKHNISIVQLIDFIEPKLQSLKYSNLLPYLSCYILSSEQIFDWLCNRYPENKRRYKESMMNFYKNESINSYLTLKVRIIIFLMRNLSKIGILYRLKIYTVILKLYKLFL